MKLTIQFAAIFLALSSSSLMAAETTGSAFKVGFVDLQKALQSVDAGKTAKSDLEKKVTAKRTELEKAQAALQQEAEAFEKKAALLSDAEKQKKQVELQKKFAELQKSASESQMDLQKHERELTKPLIDELRAIIEGIGRDKNLQLVLEKNEGAVLYSQGGEDLTEAVITKFNSTHKSKKK